MNDAANSQMPGSETLRKYEDYFNVIPGIKKAGPVPVLRAESLSEKEFVSGWVFKNKACLIKGAVAHWPAVQKWGDKSYWLANCSNFEMTVFPHQNYNDKKEQYADHLSMKYHDAIERLFSCRDDIFSIPSETITANNRFAGIVKDLKGFGFLTRTPTPRWAPQMRFFTYRRAATAWHYHDMDETLLCQVKGTKRVVLLPPGLPQIKFLTRFFVEERYLKGEKLDSSLDLKPQIVDVEEGDALYIPPYWHHLVVPVDDKVGFTLAYCWASPLHILGDFRNYYVRRIYKQAITSMSARSLSAPFIALISGSLYLAKKITGKA